MQEEGERNCFPWSKKGHEGSTNEVRGFFPDCSKKEGLILNTAPRVSQPSQLQRTHAVAQELMLRHHNQSEELLV